MPIATIMAESPSSEPGAPVAADAIDPELIKLKRARPKIGVITAAGIVFLCAVFLIRLGPDRRFSGSGSEPTKVSAADIVDGKVGLDQLISVDAEPLVAHAIRTTQAKGSLGLRVAPARGTGDRLWIVLSGDGWEPPTKAAYVGRLRKLDDLAFAKSVEDYAAEHPRPVFATAAAVRSGFATGKLATLTGDAVTVGDGDQVALDVIDPNASTIVASFNERLPDTGAWNTALAAAGITVSETGTPDVALGQVRFGVPAAVTATTEKLEHAGLWAARVEPVTHHYQTTWATLKTSTPAGLNVGASAPIPDTGIDLVGLMITRPIPSDAYALILGEHPADYWYVMPITVGLALIGLVFAWALVRAVRRDLLPTRAQP